MKERLNIELETELKAQLKASAEGDRRSVNAQVAVLIEEALAARKAKVAA